MPGVKKITAKQTAFADCVASGMTISNAYREAYDAENMAASTIHANACRLAVNSKIEARVAEQVALKADERRIDSLSNRVKVMNKLTALMNDTKMPGSVQLNAAVWLGKTDAMFTDVTETNEPSKDPAIIARQIQDRIKELKDKGKAPPLKQVNS